MFYFDDDRRKYLAGQIGDLGKNILTVGFASYFFEKFPLSLRIGLCIIGCILLLVGYFIQPSQKGV